MTGTRCHLLIKSPVLNYLQQALERTLAITPQDTQALVQYGRVLLYRGNVDGAREKFVSALQINPDYGRRDTI